MPTRQKSAIGHGPLGRSLGEVDVLDDASGLGSRRVQKREPDRQPHSGGVDREGTGVQHVVRVHALLHEDGSGAVKDRDGRHRSPVDPAGLVVGFERIEADAAHGAIPAP